MKIAVIDTSALIRLYIPDGPIPDHLESYIDSAWQGEAVLMVPEIAIAEAAQVLLKKQKAGYLSENDADDILTAILELPMEVFGHGALISEAVSIARMYDLTVYDALFFSLAKKKKGKLITADGRLKAAFEKL